MREPIREKPLPPILRLKKRIYKANGFFLGEISLNKIGLGKFSQLLDEITNFTSECVDFCRNLSMIRELVLSDFSSNIESSSRTIYQSLIKGNCLDNITREKCIEMKTSMDNFDEFLVSNEGKLRKVIYKTQSCSETRNKINQEDCLGWFEIFWVLTVHYKFFFFWYFYVYWNVLSSLETTLNEYLSANSGGDSRVKKIRECLLQISSKKDDIGDITKDEDHWFDSDFSNSIKTFIGLDKIEFNGIVCRNNFNIMLMDYKHFRMFQKSLSMSFSTEKYTKELEKLVSALELKTSLYVIFGLKDQSKESIIISTSRDKTKCRLSPAKIKVFANFFQKFKKSFYNMCQIPLASNNMTKIVFINFTVYKKTVGSNQSLQMNNEVTNTSEQSLQLSSLSRFYRAKIDRLNEFSDVQSSVVEYDILCLITRNIQRQMSKEFDVLVNIAKMTSDRLLGRLVELDELVDSYYYFKISQEKNGILNNIKKTLQRQSVMSLSDQTKKRKTRESDNVDPKKQKNNAMISSTIEQEVHPDEIITEDISFVYKKYPSSRDFIDILVNRSTREKYFFERLVFKMNQYDMYTNFPDYHQKKLLQELTMLESFFAKLNRYIMTTNTESVSDINNSENEKSAMDYFYFDISKCNDVHKLMKRLENVEYPVILKRMARYDIFFFQVALKKEEQILIIKDKSYKVLYKCGDLLTALSTWIFILVKYYDPSLSRKSLNNIELHMDSIVKLFLDPECDFNEK